MTLRASIVLLLLLVASSPLAQSIRDRIRLSKDKLAPVSDAQANELTLTLSDAAIRPIQIVVRAAGAIDRGGKAITAALVQGDAGYVRLGQRVRAYPPESRSSMFQAKITNLTIRGKSTTVTATLSGPAHEGSTHYILEIVTEPLEVLSVPNEAIIESEGEHLVYVQAEKGRYVPRQIRPGLQGELYTQVLDGLQPGDQVVTFGSFFIDAEHKLKGS